LTGPHVELLYFTGCPAYRRARERTLAVMAALGLPPQVAMTRVRSEREAARLNFPGSPTLRVDGADVDPEGAARGGSRGLVSREYNAGGAREDIPPEAAIRKALAATLQGRAR
jgi:hypothetical protein